MSWFGIGEKFRFLILAIFVMGMRFIIFSGFIILFATNHYQIVLAFTWIVSSYFAFLLYKHLVFINKEEHFMQYMKSLMIWAGSYVVNVFLLDLFIEKFNYSVYWAQGIIISFLLVTNYLLFKYFAFR